MLMVHAEPYATILGRGADDRIQDRTSRARGHTSE